MRRKEGDDRGKTSWGTQEGRKGRGKAVIEEVGREGKGKGTGGGREGKGKGGGREREVT